MTPTFDLHLQSHLTSRMHLSEPVLVHFLIGPTMLWLTVWFLHGSITFRDFIQISKFIDLSPSETEHSPNESGNTTSNGFIYFPHTPKRMRMLKWRQQVLWGTLLPCNFTAARLWLFMSHCKRKPRGHRGGHNIDTFLIITIFWVSTSRQSYGELWRCRGRSKSLNTYRLCYIWKVHSKASPRPEVRPAQLTTARDVGIWCGRGSHVRS